MTMTAFFETERASRSLTALCHHFGRKVAANCDDHAGWVEFPFGRCEFLASDNQLTLTASAEEESHLAQVTQIVTNHLERFEFRENPTLTWKAEPREAR